MENKLVTIITFNTHFTVKVRKGDLIIPFLHHFNTHKLEFNKRLKRMIKVLDKKYYGYTKYLDLYRLHINTLPDYILYLRTKGLTKDDIEIRIGDDYKPKKLDLKMNDGYILRDYQKDYKDAILSDDMKIAAIILQTGGGKTVISMSTVIGKNYRLGILLSGYIDKWIGDVKRLTNIKDEEIYVIQGKKSLDNLLVKIKDKNFNPKIIIFSSSTMMNYLKEYEVINSLKHFSYKTKPEDLMSELGIGTLLIDEVHENFYSIFKLNLYFNVKLLIGMSATLTSADDEVKKLMKIFFNSKATLNLMPINKYINTYSISYLINNPKRLRMSHNGSAYSHTAFEDSILRDRRLLNNYLDMVDYYLNQSYFKRRKEGQKAALYFSTIRMATVASEFFKNKYKKFDVRRYCDGDPFENVIDADIRVTTMKSGSTAIDIPNLITVIQTVVVLSEVANKQTHGRLREIKGTDVEFYYLWAYNIHKHNQFNRVRALQLTPFSKKFEVHRYHDTI